MDIEYINNNEKFYDIDRNGKKDANRIEEAKKQIYIIILYETDLNTDSLASEIVRLEERSNQTARNTGSSRSPGISRP